MSGIIVPGYGPDRPKIIAVGEAPANEEEKLGRPFVGNAGQLLRRHLMQNGLDPDQIYMTNLSLIRPPADKMKNFFNPADGEPLLPIYQGLARLKQDILDRKPNLILALGAHPLWALTGLGKWNPDPEIRAYTGIKEWRG